MFTLVLTILLSLSMLLAMFMAGQVIYAARHYRFGKEQVKATPIQKVPSVTVCIPARNETHALTRCLEAVIGSDYPKLEIIVLDDESVDNTSILIKSFANSGVRFIKGSPLPDGWTGRNFAYQNLLNNANGEYVLFMGVDTHIERDTITQLMTYLQRKKVQMISVLPIRLDNYRASVLFSPFRFLNELVYNFKGNPPVTSNAWLVNRDLFGEYVAGDFEAYKGDVMSELRIGREFAKHGEYSFLISPAASGVSYEKKWGSQVETSIRQYALGVGRSFWQSLATVLTLALYITPSVCAIIAILARDPIFTSLFLAAEALMMLTYALYTKMAWSKGFVLAFFLFPILAVQELVIFIVSLFKKATHTVTWKGRNIYSRP